MASQVLNSLISISNWITAESWREWLASLVGIIALAYILQAEGVYEKILRLFFVLLGILVVYFVIVIIHTLS